MYFDCGYALPFTKLSIRFLQQIVHEFRRNFTQNDKTQRGFSSRVGGNAADGIVDDIWIGQQHHFNIIGVDVKTPRDDHGLLTILECQKTVASNNPISPERK